MPGATAPAGARGASGTAQLCVGACDSDAARLVPGDPDPWVLLSGPLPGASFTEATLVDAIGDPTARTLRPSVPPPRA